MVNIAKQNPFKIISFLVAVLALGACTKKEASAPALKQLHVFTWSDYLKEDVIKEFEAEQHAKVILDYFSSNEELLAKIQASAQANSPGYDLIFPSDYMAGNMTKLNLIQSLDKAKLKILGDFMPNFAKPAYDPEMNHVIPFAWGTTGLAVNTKLAKGIDLSKGLSWKDVFENPAFAGKVTMLDDAKENLHAALLIQGKQWATATEADVKAAFVYLKAHKKNLRIFTGEAKPVIEADECVLCQVYSGDALQVIKKKPEIAYLIPREGATIWTDNLAIPKNSQNVDLAYAFINKILSPDAAKRFTEQTSFPSPSEKARLLLDKKISGNPSIYPDPATFARLAFLVERTELLPIIDRLWTELKSQ